MVLPMQRVAVVGAGTLGSQIALVAANAGYAVRIFDPDPKAFARALELLREELHDKNAPSVVPLERWDALQGRITQADDLAQALAGAELVIESVPESLELKIETFARLGQLAEPGALLATNSSSLPISRWAEVTGRPEYCLNIHFYAPLRGPYMADVMGCPQTKPEVMDLGVAWVASLGFTPLPVQKEIMGFCFNRLWWAIKHHALLLWAGGYVDFKDLDRAWMLFSGMPLGPFGLMDSIGLDVVYDIGQQYYLDSGEARDAPPDTLRRMVESGRLGVKTRQGFYTYPDPEFTRPGFLKWTGSATRCGVRPVLG